MVLKITRLLIFILVMIMFTAHVSAWMDTMDFKLEKLYTKISQKPVDKQILFYKKAINTIADYKEKKQGQPDILEKLAYIESSFLSQLDSIVILGEIQLYSDSLILRFSNNSTDNYNYIIKNKSAIENTDYIFLFRYSQNLSSTIIKEITTEIYKINGEVNLLIDQEGGYINRYKSFDNYSFSDYVLHDVIVDLYVSLNIDEQGLIEALFSGEYFPSPAKIGVVYQEISDDNKQKFLRITSYIILKNLSQHGIYYHGLVIDLDRGNPAISGLDRSFSTDIEEYKKYIDAFRWASKQTGITLYGKHFPGHGAGDIDSHTGILSYASDGDYVEENLVLFEYFLDSDIETGIMVGHMYIPDYLQERFQAILSRGDFILTDDLAMQGYKKALSLDPSGAFLTTSELFKGDMQKIIIVDTQNNTGIK